MENVEPVVVKLDVLVSEGVCGAPGSAGRGHAKFRVTRVRPDRVEFVVWDPVRDPGTRATVWVRVSTVAGPGAPLGAARRRGGAARAPRGDTEARVGKLRAKCEMVFSEMLRLRHIYVANTVAESNKEKNMLVVEIRC